jgi:hypothetical protein
MACASRPSSPTILKFILSLCGCKPQCSNVSIEHPDSAAQAGNTYVFSFEFVRSLDGGVHNKGAFQLVDQTGHEHCVHTAGDGAQRGTGGSAEIELRIAVRQRGKRDRAVAHMHELHIEAVLRKDPMVPRYEQRGFPLAEAAKRDHYLVIRACSVRVGRVCCQEKKDKSGEHNGA